MDRLDANCHFKTVDKVIEYGTAGFRTRYSYVQ